MDMYSLSSQGGIPAPYCPNDSSDIISRQFFNDAGAAAVLDGRQPAFGGDDIFHGFILQQPLIADMFVDPTQNFKQPSGCSGNGSDINGLFVEEFVCGDEGRGGGGGGMRSGPPQLPRKSSLKRDRHSKINTAQGPRDRRMRLSLETARKFFDLQDNLGFDKPSKTVEWLLKNSAAAIQELLACGVFGSAAGTSSASDEAVSSIDVDTAKSTVFAVTAAKSRPSAPSAARRGGSAKVRRARSPRKTALHVPARESREKARARAKARAREKLYGAGAGATAATAEGKDSGTLIQHNANPNFSAEADSSVLGAKWCPPHAILNYHPTGNIFNEVSSNGRIFPEQWEEARPDNMGSCTTKTEISNPAAGNFVHHLLDQQDCFQFYAKTWEP